MTLLSDLFGRGLAAGLVGAAFLFSGVFRADAALFEHVRGDVTASTSLEYDDNVLFTENDETSDTVMAAAVGLEAAREWQTAVLRFGGDIRQEIYFDNSGFNNLSQNLQGSYSKEFSRYDRLELSNRFVHAEEPRSFEDAFGRQAGRYSFVRNTFSARFIRDVSQRLTARAGYSHRLYRVSRDDLVESDLHGLSAEADYVINSRMTFLGAYNFGWQEYDPGGTALLHSVTGGLRYFFSTQLYLDTITGVSFIDLEGSGDSVDPTATVALTHEASERMNLSLVFNNSTSTNSSEDSVFESWQLSARIQREISARLRGNLSAFLGEGEFQRLDIEDELRGMDARLTYQLSPDSRVYAGYRFSEVESNVTGREYQRNHYFTGFNFRF